MKKIISLVLCFIITASVPLTAFAKTQGIVPDEVQTVTLNRGEYKEYSFTAPETAVYQITVKALNKSRSDLLFQYGNDEINGGFLTDISYDNKNDTNVFTEYFAACESYNYIINFSNCVDYYDKEEQKELGIQDTAKLEFSIKKVTFPAVELGGTYTVKCTLTDFFMENEYFCMTPQVSGYYNFRSQTNDPVAPQIKIISDKCNSRFGGGYHKAFDTTIYMEKDHLYLIEISAIAFAFDENGSEPQKGEPFDAEFTFSITDGSNIPVESITAYEEKISMQKNWYDFGYFTINPAGFTPFDPDEITVTSSNPRVADTCGNYLFQNTFQFEIDSYHYGKTTITVTLPNGMSSSMKVYVKPRIIVMIEDFLATFFGIKF